MIIAISNNDELVKENIRKKREIDLIAIIRWSYKETLDNYRFIEKTDEKEKRWKQLIWLCNVTRWGLKWLNLSLNWLIRKGTWKILAFWYIIKIFNYFHFWKLFLFKRYYYILCNSQLGLHIYWFKLNFSPNNTFFLCYMITNIITHTNYRIHHII